MSDCAHVSARPSQAHRMFKACKEHSLFLPRQSRAYAALPASCPPPAAMLLPEPAALAAQQAAPSSRQRSAASCKRVGGTAQHSLFMLHGVTSLHIPMHFTARPADANTPANVEQLCFQVLDLRGQQAQLQRLAVMLLQGVLLFKSSTLRKRSAVQ